MSTSLQLDFPAIQTHLTPEEIDELSKAIKNATTLSMGPYLQKFENEFAKYIGVKYAFGVSNASSALEIAGMILDIEEGDEVILPAHTFTATALPFLRKKAKLVFADIDPDTFVMDVRDVERKISEKTKALVPVHLYGLPVQMDALMTIALKHHLAVIEDCAQSPGAEFNGVKTGRFGDFGCFSFHGQKNITTLGEGGMIVTSNNEYAENILGLRKIGQRPYENKENYWLPAMSNVIEAVPGQVPYNFALGEINAFAGHLLLKRLDEINRFRKEIYKNIISSLSLHSELKFQKIPGNCQSAYHLLPARFDGSAFGKNRDHLIDLLYTEYGIKCVVQYLPIYRYDLFQQHGYTKADCPETDRFFDNMLSFPFGSDLTESEINYLIESIDAAIVKLKG